MIILPLISDGQGILGFQFRKQKAVNESETTKHQIPL